MSDSNCNPRNIQYIHSFNIFIVLGLEQNCAFFKGFNLSLWKALAFLEKLGLWFLAKLKGGFYENCFC
jgi:hypothetical protein